MIEIGDPKENLSPYFKDFPLVIKLHVGPKVLYF
jgi:hypothetical protein